MINHLGTPQLGDRKKFVNAMCSTCHFPEAEIFRGKKGEILRQNSKFRGYFAVKIGEFAVRMKYRGISR
jgi:hypothetical protein